MFDMFLINQTSTPSTSPPANVIILYILQNCQQLMLFSVGIKIQSSIVFLVWSVLQAQIVLALDWCLTENGLWRTKPLESPNSLVIWNRLLKHVNVELEINF